MTDLPFPLTGPLAERLAAAADVEGKLVRALDTLGPLAGRDVALLDVPEGGLLRRMTDAGITPSRHPIERPLRLDAADESLDAVVSLWSGFRGVDAAEVAEVDRVLRPGGRLLVVHDYGRDDVSALRPADAPEYRAWSRRGGPFLRDGAFRIHVIHCFWTFPSIEDAQAFLGEAFGEAGVAVGAGLKRPRLSWNVAVYHRWRLGETPEDAEPASDAARPGIAPRAEALGA